MYELIYSIRIEPHEQKAQSKHDNAHFHEILSFGHGQNSVTLPICDILQLPWPMFMVELIPLYDSTCFNGD